MHAVSSSGLLPLLLLLRLLRPGPRPVTDLITRILARHTIGGGRGAECAPWPDRRTTTPPPRDDTRS